MVPHLAEGSGGQLHKVGFQQLDGAYLLSPRNHSAVGQPLCKHILPPVRGLKQRAGEVGVGGGEMWGKHGMRVCAGGESVGALMIECQSRPVSLSNPVQRLVGRLLRLQHHVPALASAPHAARAEEPRSRPGLF